MVEKLVHKGANLEIRCNEFRTPLYDALVQGEQEIFGLLITYGADVNALTHENDYLLHWAVSSEDLIFAKILLQNGALARVKDQHGITPVEFAIFEKRLNAMKLMMFYQYSKSDRLLP